MTDDAAPDGAPTDDAVEAGDPPQPAPTRHEAARVSHARTADDRPTPATAATSPMPDHADRTSRTDRTASAEQTDRTVSTARAVSSDPDARPADRRLLTDGGTTVAGESGGDDGDAGNLQSDASDVDEDADVDGTPTADAGESRLGSRTLRRYLTYAALVGLGLLAAISVLQFYLNASSAISQWVAPEFRNAFQAAFNLAVLLATLAAIYFLLDTVGD